MSEKETRKNKNTKKWDKLQTKGFWLIIIISVSFWLGIYIGGTAAHNSIKEIEHAKTSAVEEYKATLKSEQ